VRHVQRADDYGWLPFAFFGECQPSTSLIYSEKEPVRVHRWMLKSGSCIGIQGWRGLFDFMFPLVANTATDDLAIICRMLDVEAAL